MSVLVFLEVTDNQIKKSSLEALCYGRQLGGNVVALVAGNASNMADAGTYGAATVLHVQDDRFARPDAQAYAEALVQAAQTNGCSSIVMAKSAFSDSLTPKLAAQWKATAATNVVSLPDGNGTVKRSIFTGKAFEFVKLTGERKVFSVRKNAVEMTESPAAGTVTAFSVNLSSKAFAIQTLSTEKATGEVLLSDAEIVVSGGRGLKGPENWALVTDMAKVLGAATGCSKPVSDLHWRPHHEHVGQTDRKSVV